MLAGMRVRVNLWFVPGLWSQQWVASDYS